MICYKDMCFCPFYEKCKKGKNCDRALTGKVEKAAKEWWGNENAPIDVFITKPDCFEGNKNVD